MDTWDYMKNWELVLPPSRPSASQLATIRVLCSKIDRELPVAILGSTPEFRDLLHECGFRKIYVLDKNISFYEAMSKVRIYANKEVVVKGNWLDTLSNFKNTFALILSDLTSGNLSYDDRPKFYRMISDALRTKGIFFDKVLTHSGPNIPFDSLIEKYSHLPVNLLNINYFSSEMLFCGDLLDIKEIVDTTLFYSILDKRVKNQRVRAFTEQAKSKITPENCIWYYGRKWEILKKDYCPQLRVLSEVIEKDKSNPYYKRLRLFTLQK